MCVCVGGGASSVDRARATPGEEVVGSIPAVVAAHFPTGLVGVSIM